MLNIGVYDRIEKTESSPFLVVSFLFLINMDAAPGKMMSESAEILSLKSGFILTIPCSSHGRAGARPSPSPRRLGGDAFETEFGLLPPSP